MLPRQVLTHLTGILRMTTVVWIDGAVPRLAGQQAGCLRPRS
jgi:hypothetical protein